MKIAGVSMVRNAADLIAVSALHHLHSGVDVLYIVDNASTDGTDAVLARVACELPVKWLRDDGPFNQSEVLSELARSAYREGADWIVPIDADELWWTAAGDLHGELASIRAAAVECNVVQFVQRRNVWFPHPEGLLTMTRRVNEPIGTSADAHSLVVRGDIAFVEIAFPPKWILRASSNLEIPRGNHTVIGVDVEATRSETIQCLHAPLRARSIFKDRVSHAGRLEMIVNDPDIGWQTRWWKRQAENGLLDREWAANSYAGNFLDVNGVLRSLVIDLRLRNCAARWMDHELLRWSASTMNDDDMSDLQVRGPDATAETTDAAGEPANDTVEQAANAELRAQLDHSRALLQVTKERLDSALEVIADRDVVISDLDARLQRISHSLLGRWYLAVARKPFFRRLIRTVTALD